MKRKSQAEHDDMVRHVAYFLARNNYKSVRADIPGFSAPEKVPVPEGNAFVPDVSAQGKKFNIFEVETADSIFDDHSAEQWTRFSDYADERNAVFWLVVPTGSRMAADIRLMELDLDARVLEI